MTTLKHLRERIRSIRSTQKITGAMKMVAAAKLRRAQDASQAFYAYAEGIDVVLSKLTTQGLCLDDWSTDDKRLLKGGEGPPLFLVVSTDRGLCGGYNTNLIKALRLHIENVSDFHLAIIGRKGKSLINSAWRDKVLPLFLEEDGSYDSSAQLAQQLQEWLNQKIIGSVQCLHYGYKNILTQQLHLTSLVPYAGEMKADKVSEALIEPTLNILLPQLLQEHLKTQVHKILLESAACEQAARMTAMDNATRNARDILQRLQTTYNQTRQSQITNQLIEIISAAQAV